VKIRAICNKIPRNPANTCGMSFQLFLALLGFAFVTSVTPGPNNMMLMASGANFGFRRTIPHMFGISLGHSLMVFLVGLGLAGMIHALPMLLTGMKILSIAYMLWLAWKIAQSAALGEGKSNSRPFNFLQAAAFQWINPKAWAMALGATSAFAPDGSVKSYLMIAAIFACVNLPSVSVWAYAGQKLRAYLSSPARLSAFNWTMAGLLIASLIPVLLE
jgi:threonine/homoserine/homoserine lactone efflux protein